MLNVFIATAASSIGIDNLDPALCAALGPDLEYRLREIVQEAIKFMKHSKRERLTCDDVSHALQLHNVEQLFGYRSSHPPSTFLRANSSSGTLFFPQDDVVDFNKLLQTPLPPVPRDVTFSVHWLAIEGVQPAIPQNPSVKKNALIAKKKKLNVLVKPVVAHVLSVELQKYFEEISSCVLGSDESRIALAVGSVQADPGLNDLLPYFCQFVADEVAKNLRNLPVLRNLMRFSSALLSSEHLHVEPYLHQLLPSILTCLVGKTLGSDSDDHWALRDFTAALVEKIASAYGNAFVTLIPRLSKTFVGALLDFSKPLTTHYGAIKGISALGKAAQSKLLFSNLAQYVPFVMAAKDEAQRKNEANRVLSLLVDTCVAHIKSEQLENNADTQAGRKRDRTTASEELTLFRDVLGAAFEKAAKSAGVELK